MARTSRGARHEARLRGDIAQISDIKRRIKAMPMSIAHDVAQRAGPAMTTLTVEAFDGGRSVYGDPRPPSKEDGHALTLRASGETARQLRFVATGTIVRCVLGTRWAKYLIGRYSILPNGAIPVAWTETLQAIVHSSKGGPDPFASGYPK